MDEVGVRFLWIGLVEAAKLMDVTVEAVRQLVHRGTLAHRRRRAFGRGGWSRIEVRRDDVTRLLEDPEFKVRRR